MKVFRAPKQTLGDLAAEDVAILIATAADVALVVDEEGTIQDMAFQRADLPLELKDADRWLGRHWAATVAEQSQPKVDAMLQEAALRRSSRWREVSYAAVRGPDVTILYAAVKLGADRNFIALGRDVRAVTALQNKLVEAQIAIERDYSKLRSAETRYRLLFQTASEPVLMVDSRTHRIVEANPAAERVFAQAPGRLIGKSFPDGLDIEEANVQQALASALKTQSRVDDLRIRLGGGLEFTISALFFRQDASAFLLVRLAPLSHGAPAAAALPDLSAKLVKFVENAPDAFALTDRDGRVLTANAAFLQLAQLHGEDQARGETIDRWLGRSEADFNVLLSNLRQHHTVKLFASVLRSEFGDITDVEISAVAVANGDRPNFGFAIRNVGRRIMAEPTNATDLPRSPEQLAELIGRVPLKELVRESTDVIERLCIEAALQITGDNRASAAEMLGLSRQSLYVKLRRFGLADAATEVEVQDQTPT